MHRSDNVEDRRSSKEKAAPQSTEQLIDHAIDLQRRQDQSYTGPLSRDAGLGDLSRGIVGPAKGVQPDDMTDAQWQSLQEEVQKLK